MVSTYTLHYTSPTSCKIILHLKKGKEICLDKERKVCYSQKKLGGYV